MKSVNKRIEDLEAKKKSQRFIVARQDLQDNKLFRIGEKEYKEEEIDLLSEQEDVCLLKVVYADKWKGNRCEDELA